MTETFVCNLSSLLSPLQEVTVNGQVILLAKTPQGIKATSPKCPHYGAPLVKGVLSGDRIVCPWHGACFSANTGDIEDAPSVDCIEVFPVRVQGDDVFVTVPDTIPAKRTPAFKTSAAKAGGKTVVVVGGGAAGNSAVETLRKEGFDGRIVMISQEQYVPYDRPKLSKNMAVGAEAIALRPKQFYQDIGVELMLGEKVVELDAATKKVRLEKGLVLDYDECIVCTGSRSFNIPVPGHDLGNVFTLRDPDDAKKIDSVITPDSNVVLIGTGFIGLEAATYLKNTKKVKNVTAVSLDKVPLERVLGACLGELLQKVHESNGVKMLLGVHLQSYQGKDGKVTGVVINEQKEAIPADVVFVGAGVRLNTDFLKNVDLHNPDKSILVDKHMKSSSGLYAAGDIARFPYLLEGGNKHVRIEHWGVAQNQGRVAALNILGKGVEFRNTPYFWSVQFPGSLRYAGYCESPEEILIFGTPETDGKFVALFGSGDKVQALSTLGRDPLCSAGSELLHRGTFPSLSSLKGLSVDQLSTRILELL